MQEYLIKVSNKSRRQQTGDYGKQTAKPGQSQDSAGKEIFYYYIEGCGFNFFD
jgi:hypothetical protein